MTAKTILKSETILITGAAGSIGKALTLGLASSGVSHLILVDHAETAMHSLLAVVKRTAPDLEVSFFVESIGNLQFLKYLFEQFAIDRIIHAAAYKHVALMEANACSAIMTNISAAKVLIDTAERNKINQLVFISTDKAVNPASLMGRTKKVVEEYMLQRQRAGAKTRLTILRLCNVYGSSGSVVPVFQERIAHNLPVIIRGKNTRRAFIDQEALLPLIHTVFNAKATGLIYIPKNFEVHTIETIAKKVLLENAKSDTSYPISYTPLLPSEKQEEQLIAADEKPIETPFENLQEIGQLGAVELDLKLLDACIHAASQYQMETATQLLIQLTADAG